MSFTKCHICGILFLLEELCSSTALQSSPGRKVPCNRWCVSPSMKKMELSVIAEVVEGYSVEDKLLSSRLNNGKRPAVKSVHGFPSLLVEPISASVATRSVPETKVGVFMQVMWFLR